MLRSPRSSRSLLLRGAVLEAFLELVDLVLEITAGAPVEAGQLDHGTPVVSADPHPCATGPDEQRAEQTQDGQEYAGQRYQLAGAVADLELDPPVDAVEGDRSRVAGQLLGLPERDVEPEVVAVGLLEHL